LKVVTKYVCEHCGREYRKPKHAEHHEEVCWQNKALKACPPCKFYGGMDYEVEGFNRYDFIVCRSEHSVLCAPDGKEPVLNCEEWEERK
jgi:DNA-directed RNA polymerase subunit RPC12/RpoP